MFADIPLARESNMATLSVRVGKDNRIAGYKNVPLNMAVKCN